MHADNQALKSPAAPLSEAGDDGRPVAAVPVGSLRQVLGNHSYRNLFTAQVVALIGTGLLTIALGLLAFDIAGGDAGVVLATALTIKMVAYVAVAPVMTACTQRVDRKVLLVSADIARAGVACFLPFVGQAWQIYVLIFVLQSASATFTPAFQAVIPDILPDEREYTRAISLARLAYDLESLASPVLAAALLTVISYNSLFLGTAAGFVLSALLVMSTALPVRRPPAPARFLSRLTSGIRVFVGTRELRALLALNVAVAAATAMVVVNTVVLVQGVLGRSPGDVAVLLACFGGGSMLVALALAKLLDTFAERSVMLAGAALIPLGLAAAALASTGDSPARWSGALLAWFVLGAATSLVLTPSARLLRRASNTENRPAVFAAQFSLSHACFMLTYPIAGTLGAFVGLPAAAAVLAGIAAAAGIIAATTWRRSSARPD